MPWHLRTMKGLNPTTPDERERQVRKVVETDHGASLEGFWLSEDDRTGYALIDASDAEIGEITRDLDAKRLKKVKARK